MDDERIVTDCMGLLRPWRQTVEHDDEIGLFEQVVRVRPGMHRMVGRQRQLHRPILADGNGPVLDQRRERRKRLGAARAMLGKDHRKLRRCNALGQVVYLTLVSSNAGRLHGKGPRHLWPGIGLAQNLARQRHIDRPFGGRVGDGIGAVRHFAHLFGEAQFVVPFARLAHQGRLVAHFLAPADGHGSGAEAPLFGGWRAARKQQHRDILHRSVDRANGTIGETDIGVRHHHLRFAGGQIIAMRHAHGRAFMRHHQRLWQRHALGGGLSQPLDDRRKVGARIGEDIVDANGFQTGQQRAASGEGWCIALHLAIIVGSTSIKA